MSAAVPSQRTMNPMWVVSLFMTFSEITVGVAASRTDGWIQVLFAVFSTAFPTAVFVVFFVTLWKRPYVLYAPKDYPQHTRVEDFVSALRSASSSQLDVFKSSVKEALEETVTAGPADPDAGKAIEDALARAVDKFESRVVEVDLREVDEELGTFGLAVDDDMSVAEFLNLVYFAIAPAVRPFTYGLEWYLEDDAGRRRSDLGSRWARTENGLTDDTRPLSAVSVNPGDRLKVRLVGGRDRALAGRR